MKKGTILLWAGGVVLFSITFFLGSRSDKKEFVKFDSSTINGLITEIRMDQGSSVFTVGNHKYQFAPIYKDSKPDFLLFAEKGYSIFKPAKADTLKLIHHGKIYLYTFEKL